MAEKITTRSTILRAAPALIAEHGFHGTSVQMIADRAGVGIGSLYRYYKGKDELIHAVCDEIEKKIEIDVFGDCSGHMSIENRFSCLGLSLTLWFMENPNDFMFLDRYFVSPYGINKKKERFSKGSLECKYSGDGFKPLFENGINSRIIKDLPLAILYALTLNPLVSLVNDHIVGIFDLDEVAIQKTIDATWEAVKR